jgi:hypothetical protein
VNSAQKTGQTHKGPRFDPSKAFGLLLGKQQNVPPHRVQDVHPRH